MVILCCCIILTVKGREYFGRDEISGISRSVLLSASEKEVSLPTPYEIPLIWEKAFLLFLQSVK